MAIKTEDVTIDDVNLVRYYSDKNVKIKSNEEGNIYPIAYVVKGSTVEFSETDIPLNEISSGMRVRYQDVIGLSGYVSSLVDYLADDVYGDGANVDLGGA